MKKYKYEFRDGERKSGKRGLVPLSNGWSLVCPVGKATSDDLMVAIGALVSIYSSGFKDTGYEKEKLKDMITTYIDSIWEGKLPDGIFIKRSEVEKNE